MDIALDAMGEIMLRFAVRCHDCRQRFTLYTHDLRYLTAKSGDPIDPAQFRCPFCDDERQ